MHLKPGGWVVGWHLPAAVQELWVDHGSKSFACVRMLVTGVECCPCLAWHRHQGQLLISSVVPEAPAFLQCSTYSSYAQPIQASRSTHLLISNSVTLIAVACMQAGHAASPQALVMVNASPRAFSSAGDRSLVAWDLQVQAFI
jgi:hypothetical protein